MNVPCHFCGAAPGKACSRGYPHAVRRKLAAMPKPAMHGKYPIATVQRISEPDWQGARVVTILCPLCGALHWHGLPPGEQQVGHRVAHCRWQLEPGGYWIPFQE